MWQSIAEAVSRFKTEWTRELEGDSIREICLENGYRWRERILDPVTTIHLFLLQVLHGNTAIAHLRHLAKRSFSAESYCLARARLPLKIFEQLVQRTGERLQEQELDEGRWRGHRVFFADGSSFSMPDTPELQERFGQPKNQRQGCGFPVARFLAMFHATSGMIIKVFTAGVYAHDMSLAPQLHPELRPNDLLVADRAFCSYAHFCSLIREQVDAVFRFNGSQLFDFVRSAVYDKGKRLRLRRLRRCGVRDQIIEWVKPHKQQATWMTPEQFAALPQRIVIRQLQYRTAIRGFRSQQIVLVTTLLDSEIYPAHALAELYRQRWSIEINFRHLKVTLGMDVLRCMSVEGVLKELMVFCIVYNLVCIVTNAASRQQLVPRERVSFIDALRWLLTAPHRHSLTDLQILPLRKNRIQPRVKKRRPKSYSLMTTSRTDLLNQLYSQPLAA